MTGSRRVDLADPQFWLVTVAALAAAIIAVRALVPARRRGVRTPLTTSMKRPRG